MENSKLSYSLRHMGSIIEYSKPMFDEKIETLFLNKKVSIVGPSATLYDLGLGEFIDSHDLVCRFNHHLMFHEDMFVDYGSRNDVLFSDGSRRSEFFDALNVVQPETICFLRRKGRDNDSVYPKMIRNLNKNYPGIYCYHSGNHYSEEWKDHIGTDVNTGLLSVLFLLHFKVKSIYMTGFDFYQNREWYHRKVTARPILNDIYDKQKGGFIEMHSGHNQMIQLKYLAEIEKSFPELIVDETIRSLIDSYA